VAVSRIAKVKIARGVPSTLKSAASNKDQGKEAEDQRRRKKDGEGPIKKKCFQR